MAVVFQFGTRTSLIVSIFDYYFSMCFFFYVDERQNLIPLENHLLVYIYNRLVYHLAYRFTRHFQHDTHFNDDSTKETHV